MIQFNPFITLYLGSIRMDRAISEPCYKETILQGIIGKTISCLFSYNSLKVHGKKSWEPQHDRVISKSVIKKFVIKGQYCIRIFKDQ